MSMKFAQIVLGTLALTINFLIGAQQAPDFQQLPKGELHLHLGGSFPKEYLFSIASKMQQEQLEHALNLIKLKVDYNAAFHVFKLVAEIVDTEEKLQEGVESLCAKLQEDNVHYVEIRTGLKDL